MKKFMVLYMVPVGALDAMTPEEKQAGMSAWGVWMGAHGGDLADMGAPFGKNMRVTKDGATVEHNEMTGYSIVQAETQEDAAKIVQDSPNFMTAGAYIEVMEVMQM